MKSIVKTRTEMVSSTEINILKELVKPWTKKGYIIVCADYHTIGMVKTAYELFPFDILSKYEFTARGQTEVLMAHVC